MTKFKVNDQVLYKRDDLRGRITGKPSANLWTVWFEDKSSRYCLDSELELIEPEKEAKGCQYCKYVEPSSVCGMGRGSVMSSYLTGDQKTVLKALKVDQDGWYPFFTIWHMMENDEISSMPTKQQFQVLAAFAEWGMEKEEE